MMRGMDGASQRPMRATMYAHASDALLASGCMRVSGRPPSGTLTENSLIIPPAAALAVSKSAADGGLADNGVGQSDYLGTRT